MNSISLKYTVNSIHVYNFIIHTLFGITLSLYLLKLSAGKAFCKFTNLRQLERGFVFKFVQFWLGY